MARPKNTNYTITNEDFFDTDVADFIYTDTVKWMTNIQNMSAVTRFHGVFRLKDQSIGDHSARTAMLAFLIALEYFKDENLAYKAAVAALFHDFTESLLHNDANHNLKSNLTFKKGLLEEEKKAVSTISSISNVQSTLIAEFALEKCSDDDINQIVKVADSIDFGLYAFREYKMGNTFMLEKVYGFFELYTNFPFVFQQIAFIKNIVTYMKSNINA